MADAAGYVGRGGIKLRHALDVFALDVAGMTCADFGANVGGFTDCLLKAGAARVYAVDTGYGALAYALRIDPRVVVMERTNALHAPRPRDARGGEAVIDLVVIDMAWTPQRLAIPSALRWVKPGGLIVSLIKPHYELAPEEKRLLKRGVLEEREAARVAERTSAAIAGMGVEVLGLTKSPIVGGAGKKSRGGNAEWLIGCRASR